MANPRELADQAFTLLKDALRDSEARVSELEAELERRREPRDPVEQRLEQVDGELAKWRERADHVEELYQNERAKAQQLRKKLEIAESGPDRLNKKEINYWRQRVEQFDEEAREYRARIARLQHKLQERSRPNGAEAEARAEAEAEAAQPAQLSSDKTEIDSELEATQRENRSLREQLDQYHAEIETLRAKHAELSSSSKDNGERAAAETARAEEAERRAQEAEAALEQQRAELERSLEEARGQITSLEAELREEKEVSDNLSELANERRETVTKLQEKVEELEERYAESEWRLGKARHFERLVRRRKGLVRNLIATIRAKHKANTALKAGLDGLRRYKATAETNQQKLLKRIDKLNAELEAAREKLAERAAAATKGHDETAGKVAALEERLATQAEIIESLETELKAAKAARRARDDAATEAAELRQTLQAKDNIIAELQKDIEHQGRKLGKLRGSESETMRLKAIAEQDKGQIEMLKREVTKLREMLTQTQADQLGTDVSELIDKLEQHEQSIARLTSAIEEKDAHIATLTETADDRKRKHEFLSADEQDSYKSAAHE